MKRWVITGGIACGKSTVGALLRRFRPEAAFFSCDEAVAALYASAEVAAEIGQAFSGKDVFDDAGRLDRRKLRERAFLDPSARRKLEEVLHPPVLAGLERAAAAAAEGHNLFVAEVPLYYEVGGSIPADLVIAVACSKELQIRRLKERRGLDDAACLRMLASQWPVDAKAENASLVIWNDGELSALEDQVSILASQPQ